MGLIYACDSCGYYPTVKQGKTYSEVRAVDVSGNDGDAGPRLPALRDCKGEQGALVPKREDGKGISLFSDKCLKQLTS